jgi:hypothetical protein
VIADWAKSKSIEQVIWTDLESNFSDKVEGKKPFSVPAAIEHLKRLSPNGQRMAADYVFKAPESVQTRLRKALEQEAWFAKLKGPKSETA